MKEQEMENQFWKFVLPSMLTMMLNGLYTIVDGFFIGHAVGDVGLAGIGLAWPIAAVLLALGMGIGVGGSVVMSTYRGYGNDTEANEARGNTILLLFVVSIFMTVFLTLFSPLLVKALGARGKVYDSAIAYIRIIALGGGMQIFASGLIPIIRNSHKTVEAMLIMGTGLVLNIGLDALFTMVIPLGLAGAALATVLAQTFTVVGGSICLFRLKEHRFKKSDFRWNKAMIIKMSKIAISPFGLSLMPSLITVFNNFQCITYGGNLAVSAYAVVNYLIASVLLLLEGIGEGMQPLISYFNGAGNYKAMHKILRQGVTAVVGFSMAFLLLTIPARTWLPQFFATSEETAKIIEGALPILAMAFPMMGMGKLFTSYFYACDTALFSTLLVYADPILFTPLCIVTLPYVWGLKGVWMALPGAQILTMLLLAVLLSIHMKKQKHRKAATDIL